MECDRPKKMCSFFAGNTIVYDVLLNKSDGSVIDISDMDMFFTMKINKNDPDNAKTSIQVKHTFPRDEVSRLGKGVIEIPSRLTKKLLVNRWYHFDFELWIGKRNFTIGSGTVYVKKKVKDV